MGNGKGENTEKGLAQEERAPVAEGEPLDGTLWSVGSHGHVRKAEKDREEQKERN